MERAKSVYTTFKPTLKLLNRNTLIEQSTTLIEYSCLLEYN